MRPQDNGFFYENGSGIGVSDAFLNTIGGCIGILTLGYFSELFIASWLFCIYICSVKKLIEKMFLQWEDNKYNNWNSIQCSPTFISYQKVPQCQKIKFSVSLTTNPTSLSCLNCRVFYKQLLLSPHLVNGNCTSRVLFFFYYYLKIFIWWYNINSIFKIFYCFLHFIAFFFYRLIY